MYIASPLFSGPMTSNVDFTALHAFWFVVTSYFAIVAEITRLAGASFRTIFAMVLDMSL